MRDVLANSTELQSHWLRLLNHRSEVTVAEVYSESRAMVVNRLNSDVMLAADVMNEAILNRPHSKPVRIGFLFNDFQSEVDVCQFWLKPILLHIDRSRFELFLYSDEVPVGKIPRPTEAGSDVWVETAHLSNQELVNRIRGDKIDVLFDLIGHGLQNRLKVFAERPANFQYTWAGYLATTGLKQMDYILADETIFPESIAPYFSETPIRLPNAYLAFVPPSQDAPSRTPPFREHGWITFGSAASPEKNVGRDRRLVENSFESRKI